MQPVHVMARCSARLGAHVCPGVSPKTRPHGVSDSKDLRARRRCSPRPSSSAADGAARRDRDGFGMQLRRSLRALLRNSEARSCYPARARGCHRKLESGWSRGRKSGEPARARPPVRPPPRLAPALAGGRGLCVPQVLLVAVHWHTGVRKPPPAPLEPGPVPAAGACSTVLVVTRKAPSGTVP